MTFHLDRLFVKGIHVLAVEETSPHGQAAHVEICVR